MNHEPVWDVLIIGCGPTGLMSGIAAARLQKKVLILDGQDRPGKKLLITGGGRCNITHREVTERDYQSGDLRTVRNVLRAFPVFAALKFFSDLGLSFTEEEDGKIFPSSDSARAVLEALLSEATKCGVRIEKLKKVSNITVRGGIFSVGGAGFNYEGRTVILATGGLSYPETGSGGSGYSIARSLGHTIVPVTPALAPFSLEDTAWNSLAGITLPAGLSLVCAGKKIASSRGPLLFTHVGISGPGAMDLSRHWSKGDEKKRAGLRVNFLPQQKPARFLDEIEKTAAEQPSLSLKKALARYFPERLAEVLLKKGGLDPKGQLAHCSRKDRQALSRAVFEMPVEVSGVFGYEKAEATAGGVNMAEVDPKTLESKLCPGLFFAGEVLDVDGRIGGFNLHWAWASGHVTGGSAAQRGQAPFPRSISTASARGRIRSMSCGG